MPKGRHWEYQPRDPGGEGGGRWVKAAGRATKTAGRFGKKNFAGRGNQRTLAGKRLADRARAEYKLDNAKHHHKKNPTGRTLDNRDRALSNLGAANRRAYGNSFGARAAYHTFSPKGAGRAPRSVLSNYERTFGTEN